MNTRDAELVVEFVQDYVATSHNQTGMLYTDIIDRLMKAAEGKPGTGACICMVSPEARERVIAGWSEPERQRFAPNLNLDHRCPHHGEKAQPTLWGRHKEKELTVTIHQWESLGVTPSE